MVRDLRYILDGWEFEPGKISVRKIIGLDRKEKIQARVDLGLIQFEVAGRPDGQRPHDCESLLEHHQRRRTQQKADNGGFRLTPQECRDLRHEAYLYHQRYVSLFVLEDFEGVIRDTEQTLCVIDLCARHAAGQADREALAVYRNYALMMNARARALLAARGADHESALAIADEAVTRLRRIAADSADAVREDGAPIDNSGEIEMLLALRAELIAAMPADALPRLRSELADAVAAEDYELATQLRDQIRKARQAKRPGGAEQGEEGQGGSG
jgi:hypothetical protein